MIPDELRRLITKYDHKIPRYTSYPTAAELIGVTDAADATAALKACAKAPVSLYIHLPFCSSLCWFCACNKIVCEDKEVVNPYLDALLKEIRLVTESADAKIHLGQIHLGGGSPTFLTGPQMSALIEMLQHNFLGFAEAAKSIELDPRTTTDEQIAVLAAAGFTRASLGVQDFDETVQRLVHRIQPREMVESVVAKLRNAGFRSINFDLIYGLPGQTRDSIQATVSEVIAMRPDRIALYGYAHVQWKVKVQKVLEKYPLPNPEQRIEYFTLAEEMLLDSGYLSLGLDHFALPSDELVAHAEANTLHRTFMGYTTVEGEGVLGLGVSAISDLNGTLYQNEVQLEEYYGALRRDELPIARARVRTANDTVRAYMIERLMCDGELHVQSAPKNMQEEVFAALTEASSQLRQLEEDGILVQKGESIRATFYGRFFLRTIASQFDQYLGGGTGKFSQAV